MTSGGIELPDVAIERTGNQEGIVVAVGPGRLLKDGVTRVPINLKPGDEIVYGEFSGADYTIDGVKYKLLAESEVLCVIEED